MTKFNPSSERKLAGADAPSFPDQVELPTQAQRMSHVAGSGRLDAASIVDPMPLDSPNGFDDMSLLQLAQQNFDTSEEYFNASHRTRIMDAMARFRSMHPKGSKYWQDNYAKRSKVFRPKTRSTIRKREAAAILSFFSTSDIAAIDATDNGNTDAARDARLQNALLNHRLNEDPRFYQMVFGAVQDADRQGIVCAATEWEYREATKYYEHHMSDGTRQRHAMAQPVFDRPNWRLIPIENMRFSPAVNWMNPVESSPYLIELRPTYVCDIKDYMRNPRARLKYRKLSDAQLMLGVQSNDWDPIRIQREGNKQDRYARQGEIADYSTVWVHRNIIRINGEDYVYDTIGTSVMLSDMVPLNQMDPRGYRPYVIGAATMETHNPYPEGTATLMAQLQDEINENANLRTDMNKMATAGRMFVKRSAGIDLHALARFSPGAAIEMDDPNSVRWDRPAQVPQSNYEENNLLNTETDDLIGNFNQSSVAANKQLNETVGGMQMLGDIGTQMTEYDMRTLAKTFYEPILRQTLDMLRMFETDRNLASVIGKKFAMSEQQYWKSLQTPTQLVCNVGFGGTNPMARLGKLKLAMGMMGEFFPYLMMMSDQAEIAQEIFGACGYPNAERFFPFLDEKQQQDPKYRTLVMQLNQMRMLSFPHIAEAQGRQQQGQAQAMGTISAAKIRAEAQIQVAREGAAAKQKLQQMQNDMALVELKLEYAKADLDKQTLMLEREKLAADIAEKQQQLAIQAQGTLVQNPHATEDESGAPPDQAKLQGGLENPGSKSPYLPSLDEIMAQLAGINDPTLKDAQQRNDDADQYGDQGITAGQLSQADQTQQEATPA
jgi:hypothetical protein